MGRYNVSMNEGQWQVSGHGQQPSLLFPDKGAALMHAIERAVSEQPSQVVVKRRDGTVQRRFNFPAAPELQST